MLLPGVPEHWAMVEAKLTQSVRELGVPAPELLDVIVIDGRPTVLFRHIDGPTMWQLMSADTTSIPSFVRDFAEVQRSIHRAGVPEFLPGAVDRMCSKIGDVDAVGDAEWARAVDIVEHLPRGAALLHGDLHPGNIVVSAAGLVAVDWFDASVGHPVADIARSSLLISAKTLTDRRHLPGATDDDLGAMHDAYVSEMSDVLEVAGVRMHEWHAITALSRVAEGTDDDVDRLILRWRDQLAQVSNESALG